MTAPEVRGAKITFERRKRTPAGRTGICIQSIIVLIISRLLILNTGKVVAGGPKTCLWKKNHICRDFAYGCERFIFT
jgi:hypothetical protein